jgi:hypothetical protein
MGRMNLWMDRNPARWAGLRYFGPLAQPREFARRVIAVEKLKTAQRALLAELDALFATLQHRAFCGEL